MQVLCTLMRMPTRLRSYLWLLLNVLCWGSLLVVAKPALDYVSPFRLLFYRYLWASVLALLIVSYFWFFQLPRMRSRVQTTARSTRRVQKTLPPTSTLLWRSLLMEVVGTGVGLSLLYTGLQRTSAIQASLIATTLPIFITLGGVWWLHEREERHESVGLVIAALATIALTLIPFFRQGQAGWSLSLMGSLLIIGHNVLAVWYFLRAKTWYRGWPKLVVTSMGCLVGLATFAGLAWWESHLGLSAFTQSVLHDLQQPVIAQSTLFLTFIGTFLGSTAYMKGQEDIESSEASVFWYLQAGVYIPLSWFMLGERLDWVQLTCLFFVVLGVAIAEMWYTPPSRNTHSRTKRG